MRTGWGPEEPLLSTLIAPLVLAGPGPVELEEKARIAWRDGDPVAAAEAALRIGDADRALAALGRAAAAAPSPRIDLRRARLYADLGELEAAAALLHALEGPSPRVAAAAAHLEGVVTAASGDLDTAAGRFEVALAQRRDLEVGAGEVAQTLTALAQVLAAAGRLDEARDRLAEAERLLEADRGADHPSVALAAARTVDAGLAAGEPPADAIARLEEVLRGLETRPRHPVRVRVQGVLSRAAEAAGRADDAREWATAALRLARANRDELATVVPPPVALRLEADATAALHRWLALAPDAGEAWREVLAHEGGPVEGSEAWHGARVALGASLLAGIGGRPLEGDDPEALAGAVEAGRPAEPGGDLAAAVCRALPPEAVLVRYLVVGDRYEAFVLRPDCAVRRLALGPVEAIEAVVEGWRATLGNARALSARIDGRGRRVRAAIWTPLQPHLDGAGEVLVVPDGALLGVPFGALPEPDGGYLIARRPVRWIHRARDLARPWAPRLVSGALVVGEADPQADPGALGTGWRWAGCRSTSAPPRGARGQAAAVAAQARASGVGDVRLLDGTVATEAAVTRAATGRRLIHVAAGAHLPACVTAGGPVFLGDPLVGRDPALVAGISLAGSTGAADAADVADGVLTAEEIGQLDLRGTELAVLTGAALPPDPRGLATLRQALADAGVRWQLATLWSGSDVTSSTVVTAFYDRWLRDASPPLPDALRSAQLLVLEANMQTWNEPRPQDWAAFVASGR